MPDLVWMFSDYPRGDQNSESKFLRAPDCQALVSFQSREFPHFKIVEQKPPKMINTRLKALSWVVPLQYAPPLNIWQTVF